MIDLAAEWLRDRAWFEQYIAEATAPALAQPELFLLCLADIRASRQEMQAALGRSSGSIAYWINKLIDTGLVTSGGKGKARALVLTGAGREAVAGYTVIRENAPSGGQVGRWQLVTVETY